MILLKISPVIPTQVGWLAMLILIGMLGLTSQVRSPISSSVMTDSGNLKPKTLLVMGLQRETASRGVLAIYISVCLIHLRSFKTPHLF